uniref:Uncharacterized protein n=1 Tax=Chromera velia CCMP2878 TaxID=1169474 RepID=A0A0G4H1N4_9ALVE|eukprot:Cvel_24352.t1-p1 / transcript=Cvel_24352.t1 / gene=Cvel_24352 / organism=Chromera_velia_CCMP2878 / gene_product=hypothetical protein / transcript_product=hypothetical protein / location=Cvel_scaffold2619:7465-10647(+) / protein_length=271 / sequence_SO=supercontig / SO=protein_coding / is_pseudo=false
MWRNAVHAAARSEFPEIVLGVPSLFIVRINLCRATVLSVSLSVNIQTELESHCDSHTLSTFPCGSLSKRDRESNSLPGREGPRGGALPQIIFEKKTVLNVMKAGVLQLPLSFESGNPHYAHPTLTLLMEEDRKAVFVFEKTEYLWGGPTDPTNPSALPYFLAFFSCTADDDSEQPECVELPETLRETIARFSAGLEPEKISQDVYAARYGQKFALLVKEGCWPTDELPGAPLPSDRCRLPCAGNPQQSCGGHRAASVVPRSRQSRSSHFFL